MDRLTTALELVALALAVAFCTIVWHLPGALGSGALACLFLAVALSPERVVTPKPAAPAPDEEAETQWAF